MLNLRGIVATLRELLYSSGRPEIMLFTIKNHLIPTLLLWVTLTSGALLARELLELEWEMVLTPAVMLAAVGWLFVIGLSDGLLFGAAWLLFRDEFLERYRALVQHFASQGAPEIVAGGVLAAGEELLFRGVILHSLLFHWEWSVPAGLLLTGVLFGASHLIRRRDLALFGLWAVWEGMLLGIVYLVSGSLLVAVLVHALHDVVGFTLFAYQRRTGWLLGVTA